MKLSTPHIIALLLASIMGLSACTTTNTGEPAQPMPEPQQPVDTFRTELETFCEPLSGELLNTPDETFAEVIYAHWTKDVTDPDVRTLIDKLTDPNTTDPYEVLGQAMSKANLATCPLRDQLFEASTLPTEPVDSPTLLPGTQATTDTEMRQALRDVVKKNLPDIQTCYKAELDTNPDFDGIVKVGLTIDDTGSVSELSLEYTEESSPSDTLATCLYEEVLMWRFPIPPAPPMKVVYPLNFKS